MRLVVFGHALLEAFDALGEIAHHVRNLAAAEQQQRDDNNDQPMGQAHDSNPSKCLAARRIRRREAWRRN
jgi:hypothetical protein